ncbi:hypothetical protein DUF68_07875 [Salmonella enterica]|nr:hypothetical protein [Salmonella enterica]
MVVQRLIIFRGEIFILAIYSVCPNGHTEVPQEQGFEHSETSHIISKHGKLNINSMFLLVKSVKSPDKN